MKKPNRRQERQNNLRNAKNRKQKNRTHQSEHERYLMKIKKLTEDLPFSHEVKDQQTKTILHLYKTKTYDIEFILSVLESGQIFGQYIDAPNGHIYTQIGNDPNSFTLQPLDPYSAVLSGYSPLFVTIEEDGQDE